MTTETTPAIKAVLDNLEEIGFAPFHTLSVEGARNRDLVSGGEGSTEPVESIRDLHIAGPDSSIPIRIYTPEGDAPFPVLLYFHGGGWVMGDLEQSELTCRTIANTAEAVVVSVDYRLAPEHPFPAAVEDCYAAIQWVHDNIDVVHGDPARVAVGGQSAGANLAAVVPLMARDFGGPDISYQLLVSPITDYSFDTESYETYAEGYFLTTADMKWFWDHYLPSDLHGSHPYASPLRARTLEGFPPASVVTGGCDPLRDDGIAYVERLEEDGVDVTHHHYESMIHGFFGLLSEPRIDEAVDCISNVADDLHDAVN